MKVIYDAQQLAYKVSANSLYGFFGATRGFLPCKSIAKTVTYIGRTLITGVCDTLRERYGCTIVYGDSDSCFFKLPSTAATSIADSFRVAEEILQVMNPTFPPPIKLELEKILHPLLCFTKKRYAGNVYTSPDAKPTMLCKGLQLIRRDCCPFVRSTMKEVLGNILNVGDAEEAVNIMRSHVLELLRDEVPMRELVLSKSLKSSYKNEKQPQLTVVRKCRERKVEEPKPGSRVEYVMVHAESICESAEDVQWAVEHKVPLDKQYYLNNQLKTPAADLLAAMGKCYSKDVLEYTPIAKLVKAVATEHKLALGKAKGLQDISTFFFPVEKRARTSS